MVRNAKKKPLQTKPLISNIPPGKLWRITKSNFILSNTHKPILPYRSHVGVL